MACIYEEVEGLSKRVGSLPIGFNPIHRHLFDRGFQLSSVLSCFLERGLDLLFPFRLSSFCLL
jgi:hypothetical protein